MIKAFADWLTYDIFQLTTGSHLADAVNFFIYDTIKLLLMLSAIIFIVSVIRSFFPPEKVKKSWPAKLNSWEIFWLHSWVLSHLFVPARQCRYLSGFWRPVFPSE
jgi:uncharacterized membrane protein YraQ (UPF0718 family)